MRCLADRQAGIRLIRILLIFYFTRFFTSAIMKQRKNILLLYIGRDGSYT